jgi:Arm DNA-binding domain
MALTNLQIQNAKPKEKAYRIADSRGLYLEITPAGGKIWRYKHRFLQKEKKPTIDIVYKHIVMNGERYVYAPRNDRRIQGFTNFF